MKQPQSNMKERADLQYDVAIIGGFGHVGLPLGIVFADRGLQVVLIDIDEQKCATLKTGKMPFAEHGAEPILQQVLGRTLHLETSLEAVAHSELVIVTVGTPIDEYLNPKTRPLLELADQLASVLRPEQCLILRSTVLPGTTWNLNEFFKQRQLSVNLAYCPERIVQGFAIEELSELPQIVSGFTERAVDCASDLFDHLGVQNIRVSVQEAELAKLFSNSWRYIQFAISNQFYMIAVEHGADYSQIYRAMTDNYARMRNFPTPGFAAGPCLLKDTLQLAAGYGNHFQLGHAAMMVNEGLPNFLVQQLLQNSDIDLARTQVGILGMAFKADSDDIRDSLSYKLSKILRFHGAEVFCSDENIRDGSFISKEELIKRCSVVFVGVPHQAYKDLRVPNGTHLVDLWGVISVTVPS